MEVSALKYSGGIGLHGRSTLLRLQSDERLVAYLRKGNTAAFDVLVARYESRLQAFCRHLLGSREDAEDVLQEERGAEAREPTVPSVKSLLVRARVSLAEAAEARLLSCDEVRIELGEVAEGLRRRPSPLVRRHLRACERCSTFRTQLKHTNRALAALLPIGPLVMFRKFALLHLSHSAGAGAGSTAASSSAASGGAAGAGAAGSTAVVGTTVVAGSATSSFVSAGIGALVTKAAAG